MYPPSLVCPQGMRKAKQIDNIRGISSLYATHNRTPSPIPNVKELIKWSYLRLTFRKIDHRLREDETTGSKASSSEISSSLSS